MSEISIAAITEIAPDLRSVRPAAEADAGLLASMREHGQLEPAIVRILGDGNYRLLHGRRRLRAARELGKLTLRAEILGIGQGPADDLVDGIANIVREAVHPIDQWRLVQSLLQRGFDLKGAADSLGLSERAARRMTLLAKLHPPIVAAMAEHGMPPMAELRDIANANIARQEAAWAQHVRGGEPPDWYDLAVKMEDGRMLRSVARFDDAMAQKHGVFWEEDLFAPPAKDGQPEWFTRNVQGFRAAQQDWIETVRVPELVAAGYQAVAAKLDKYGHPKQPAGTLESVFTDTKKPPKTLVRSLLVGRVDGEVREQLWKPDPAKAAPAAKPSKKKPAAAEADAPPPAEAETPATTEASGRNPPAESSVAAPEPEAAPPPAEPVPVPETLTEAGRIAVAEAKTLALSEHILKGEAGIETTLAALLIALSAGNVEIRRGRFARVDFDDLVEHLGRLSPPLHPHDVGKLADKALSRILEASSPATPGSGPAFNAVARLLAAPVPRFDTEAVLGAAKGDTLRALAKQTGTIPPHLKVAELKRALIGQVPDWVPPGGGYGEDGTDA